MAKKVVRASRKEIDFGFYFIPSLLGGVIAWVFADNLFWGIGVFLAVLVVNYIGFRYLHSR